MQMSPLARQARKKAHLARIAAKGTPGYIDAYNRQPTQLVKIAAQEAKRVQIAEAKAAQEVLAMSDHTAAEELFKASGQMSTAKGKK